MFLTAKRANKRTLIGLDIGHAGVRAVQLTRGGDAYTVSATARAAYRTDDNEKPRRVEEVIEQLRICLGQADFRGKNAIAALDMPELTIHALELPKTNPEELEQIVRWEVQRLMPEGEDEIEAQHWSLPETTTQGPNAIAVGALQPVVLERVAQCRGGGLTPLCVDAAALALQRFGALLGDWDSQVVWGLLDLGARQSRLVLCVEKTPVLVRTAGTGGITWTQRIADALQTSVKTAEVHKCESGITTIGRLEAIGREDVEPANDLRRTGAPRRTELGSILLGGLRSELNDLAGEIKRSYEYVVSCYPGRRPADLVLVGGGAAMNGLPEFLESALGISVRRASSFLEERSCRLRYASGRKIPLESFALSMGLALEG